MSDNSHDQHEAHTGPVKTPKQMLLLSLASFIIPVFIIIGLVFYVTSANKPASGAADAERSLTQRIQKVGVIEVRDANRPLKAGEEVYKAQCAACHAIGAAGAPKLADAGAWGARIKQGLETLVTSALKGKGAMGAQGGGDFNDIEIARAVVYLANSAGGKFEEPKAPTTEVEKK
jgi:cytochrome c5